MTHASKKVSRSTTSRCTRGEHPARRSHRDSGVGRVVGASSFAASVHADVSIVEIVVRAHRARVWGAHDRRGARPGLSRASLASGVSSSRGVAARRESIDTRRAHGVPARDRARDVRARQRSRERVRISRNERARRHRVDDDGKFRDARGETRRRRERFWPTRARDSRRRDATRGLYSPRVTRRRRFRTRSRCARRLNARSMTAAFALARFVSRSVTAAETEGHTGTANASFSRCASRRTRRRRPRASRARVVVRSSSSG